MYNRIKGGLNVVQIFNLKQTNNIVSDANINELFWSANFFSTKSLYFFRLSYI